jgi:hypothetical protein
LSAHHRGDGGGEPGIANGAKPIWANGPTAVRSNIKISDWRGVFFD